MIDLSQLHQDLLEGLAIMRDTDPVEADHYEAKLNKAYEALLSTRSDWGMIDEERVENYRLLFIEIRQKLRDWYALNS